MDTQSTSQSSTEIEMLIRELTRKIDYLTQLVQRGLPVPPVPVPPKKAYTGYIRAPTSISKQSIATAFQSIANLQSLTPSPASGQKAEAWVATFTSDSSNFFSKTHMITVDGIKYQVTRNRPMRHTHHLFILDIPDTLNHQSIIPSLKQLNGFHKVNFLPRRYHACDAVFFTDTPEFVAPPTVTIDGVEYKTSTKKPDVPEEQLPKEQLPDAVGIYDFDVAEDDPHNRLSLKAGESVQVVQADQGSGYTYVQNAGGKTGFVPTNYIRMK